MKNIFYLAISLCFIVSATSCLTLQQPEDPVRRASLEQKFTAHSDVYSAKGTFQKPAGWKVGQYVVSGLTEDGVRKSVMKLALVGKESGGFIMEMISEDARQKTGQQMLVKGLDEIASGNSQAGDFQILWIRTLAPDGTVQKMEGAMLNVMAMPMQSTLKKMFNVQAETQRKDGGTIVVPAGTFKNTTEMESVVKIMGMSFNSTVHLHPDVPINGVVRSETSDGKSVTELLEFGKTGANPSF